MKYYGKDPQIIRRLPAARHADGAGAVYIIWLVGTMGNIPRPAFIDIAGKAAISTMLVQTLKRPAEQFKLSIYC